MALTDIEQDVRLVPAVKHSPQGYLWSSYDAGAELSQSCAGDQAGCLPTAGRLTYTAMSARRVLELSVG